MKNTFDLVAFEDKHGNLGWGANHLENRFSELDAATGRMLAHDLLEHNPASIYTGIEDELLAIGAAFYVRAHKNLNLSSDIYQLAVQVLQQEYVINPLEEFEESETEDYAHWDFINFIREGSEGFYDHEYRGEYYQFEHLEHSHKKSLLVAASRNALDYMNAGYRWAMDTYQDFNIQDISDKVTKAPEPEFEGQTMEVVIDFEESEVIFNFEEYNYEEDE